MVELSINIDVPKGMEKEFKLALDKASKEFESSLKMALAKHIVSKSKFTEKDADEISEKIKKSMHESLKKEGLL